MQVQKSKCILCIEAMRVENEINVHVYNINVHNMLTTYHNIYYMCKYTY
jgi:hypothetical protein